MRWNEHLVTYSRDWKSPCPGPVHPNLIQGGHDVRSSGSFFLLALVAAIFGFTGLAGLSASIAWILLVIFVVLFVLSLLAHLVRGGSSHSHL
jgi:uncharacterized membrane protein YtjA (UPF0391 family)